MKEAIIDYHKNLDTKYLDANSKHFDWIDICKGILIIFVVAGHASAVMAPYAYLFHIPMFFFLAGYVERLHQKTMIQIMVQKFLTLMIPYFMVNIVYLIGRIGLNLFGVQGLFYEPVLGKSQIIEYVTYILKMQWNTDLGGPTWYLLCLFLVFILAKLIILLTGNQINIITVGIATVIFGIGIFLDYLDITMTYYLDVAFVAVFYLILGNFFKEKRLFDFFTYINWKVWAIILVIYCYVFAHKLGAAVDWASRHYGNPLFSLCTVLLAAVILMNLSKSLQDTKTGKVLTFFGKESLALMSLHFLCFKVCYIILVVLGVYPIWLLRNLTPPSEGWWNIWYVVVTLIMFYGLHKLLYKLPVYQWIYEGKIPVPKKIKEGVFNKYSIITVLVAIVFIVSTVPYQKVVDKVALYSMPYQIEGVYEDNFIGKEMSITLHADKSTVVNFQLYKVFDVENQCSVYVNEELVGTYEIINELTDISVPITVDGINTIHILFDKEVIPKEVGLSEDARALTVILVDGKINY